MTEKRQQKIYSSIFSTMLAYKALTLPLDIKRLCRDMGIKLCPLSQIMADTGLSQQQIFDIWGNEDGAVSTYKDRHIIGYNDYQIEGRIRFTICEEICHIILGHTEDPRFCVFNQEYSECTYQIYEKEARSGAGLILCQPQFFFANPDMLTPDNLVQLCGITKKCAVVRCDILTKFKTSICNNPLFPLLPIPRIQSTLSELSQKTIGYALDWNSVIYDRI